MKTMFIAITLLAVGCSGSKDPDASLSPKVREFKAATKKFLANCQIKINAIERKTDAEAYHRAGENAKDSYLAINEMNGNAASAKIIEEGKNLLADLSREDLGIARKRIETIEKRLDSMK